MSSPRPLRLLRSLAWLPALIVILVGFASLRAVQRRSALIAAAVAPHQDSAMAAHVPYSGAFVDVVDARRQARVDAGRRVAEAGLGLSLIHISEPTRPY